MRPTSTILDKFRGGFSPRRSGILSPGSPVCRLRRFPAITWVFPLFVVLALTLTASQVSEEAVVRRLLRDYGYTRADLGRLNVKAPGGFSVLNAALPQPHEHPWDPRLSVVDTGLGVVFSHFADGQIPGTDRKFQTRWNLVNFTPHDASGTLEIYDPNGDSLDVTVNGSSDSVFDFDLAAGDVLELVTSGTGPIKVGWVHVHSDQPLGAASSFGIRDSKGTVITDVAVSASQTAAEFTLFADSIGDSRTGLAAANPWDDAPLTLDFELHDLSGELVATEDQTLQPRGHLAKFVDELFKDVPGIDEFEGSLVVRSRGVEAAAASTELQGAGQGREFSAITLRSTGDFLTSVPVVPPPPSDSERTRLVLPQIGSGAAGGLIMTTGVILFNNTGEASTGVVEFFGSDGAPMEVTVGSQTDSVFDFALPAGGVVRMIVSGQSELKVGWARVTMDQPLEGAAVFSIFEAVNAVEASVGAQVAGTLISEVGVKAVTLYQNVSMLVDTRGVFDTGFALVYPLEESAAQANFNFSLFDNAGVFQAFRSDTVLDSKGHLAKFVTEIFNDVAGIDDFQGYLQIGSGQYFAPLALRSAGAKFTSTPNLTRANGFAPVSTLELSQTVAGTSPGFSWRLHQNDGDWALESLTISAPALGLNADAAETGDVLATGFLPANANSEIFEFVVTGKGSLLFDTVLADPEGRFPQASGSFDGDPSGGLTFEMTLQDKDPFTEVGQDGDQVYFFPAGLINAPAVPGTVEVTTEFVSVSTRPDREQRIRRRVVQEITFSGPDPARANLLNVLPLLPVSDRPLTLLGDNLGDAPLVRFPTLDQGSVASRAYRASDDSLEVFIPQEAVGGLITVDNGSGPGNPYQLNLLFNPVFESGPLSALPDPPAGNGPGDFFARFRQPVEQFFLESFTLDLDGADLRFDELAVDQQVGTGNIRGPAFSNLLLLVDSAGPDTATLRVVNASSLAPVAAITVERVAENGAPAVLRFAYAPPQLDPEPVVLDRFSALFLELRFQGLPMELPASGEVLPLSAHTFSTPTEPVLDPQSEEAMQLRLETSPISFQVIP